MYLRWKCKTNVAYRFFSIFQEESFIFLLTVRESSKLTPSAATSKNLTSLSTLNRRSQSFIVIYLYIYIREIYIYTQFNKVVQLVNLIVQLLFRLLIFLPIPYFRFLLTTNYYQLSVQNRFSLHRLQLLYNHSIQATFNATRIYAPVSYSYHCEHVSSLQRYDALLIPSSANDLSKLWEVTFIDFQVM